jgi:hypothetical protein
VTGLTELHMGDTVKLKKAHPCGSFQWEVVRLGADVGLVCNGCKRRVTLTRSELTRRIKVMSTEVSGPCQRR